MAIDRDGTQGYRIPANNIPVKLTATDLQHLNDESGANGTGVSTQDDVRWWFFLFPEPRDLTNIFVIAVAGQIGSEYVANQVMIHPIFVSTDTTNGVDGTWTQIAGGYQNPFATYGSYVTNPGYRQYIEPFVASGVRGIKFTQDVSGAGFNYLVTLHLYGTITAGNNPDRLRFWHPTIDQPLSVTPAYLDWGDVPQGSTATRQIRIKNNSASLAASSVALSINVLTDSTPSRVNMYQLSADGTTFGAPGASLALGTLSPGQISAPISIMRVTPIAEQIGVGTDRFIATAASWA